MKEYVGMSRAVRVGNAARVRRTMGARKVTLRGKFSMQKSLEMAGLSILHS